MATERHAWPPGDGEMARRIREFDWAATPLDRYGLVSALRWLLERYAKQTGVRIELRQEGAERRLPPAVEVAAYRIVQEALTNVVRYSGAERAAVRLYADGQFLTVSVRDAGQGFDPARVDSGSGLGGMRERAALLGGTLAVDAVPGEGVVVTAELPIEATDAIEEETRQ